MKRPVIASLVLAWVGVSVTVGIASAGAPADWQQTLRTARKEGKVVVSIPPSAELRKRMEEAFERRFSGIDLELVPGRGPKNVRRIADEFGAGVRYFDVHVGGTQSMLLGLILGREVIVGSLEPYLLLLEVKDPKNWWGGHIYVDREGRFAYGFAAYIAESIYYNSNIVNPEELSSYDDLLHPKWKGKIGYFDPRVPGPGDATWAYMWEVKGKGYLKRLLKQDLQITRNWRVLAESLAKGKLAITVGVSHYFLGPFLKAGLSIKPLPIPKEGTYATGGTGSLVVLKDPPHPSATRVYVNWLLGQEGQEIFSRATGHITRRLDVNTRWSRKLGIVPAKDALTVEEYYRYENQSQEKIQKVRIPARNFARRLLK